MEPAPAPDELGAAYDTEWAREPLARVTRAALQRVVLLPALRGLTSPSINGFDRIEHLDGPLIFAANHHSHLDIAMILGALPDRLRRKTVVAAAADYFFDKRIKAIVSALSINAVPIERQKVNRESTERIAALLAEGWNLIIFPEGGRSPDGLGQEFKPGSTYLSIKRQCPIVPVHIGGTNVVLPKGASVPRRHPCTVTFGEPLRPEPGADPRDLAEVLERSVDALADEATTDWWTARRRAAATTTASLRGEHGAASWRRQWSKPPAPDASQKAKRAKAWPNGD